MRERRTGVALLVMTALSCLAAEGVAQEPFTLEQVMGAPFPSNLTAAPVDGKIAWVFNIRGARNIWVAQAPDFAAHQLTAYSEDDGQAIGDLGWTPDGNILVYVRGGGPNRAGELPNPLSRPEGVSRDVWTIDFAGGAPRKLAEGTSPAIAPTGDGVAFGRGGDIWWVPLDGGDATALVKSRGGSGSLRWSPDGSKLAFVSSRGDHSFVGVYDRESKTITWLDPSVDRDNNPVWSPDGTRVAFIRFPASSLRGLFGPRRDAQPWSLRVADVATGQGREIWRADEGPGSAFRSVVASNQIFWSQGDHIVFPWEKDGWTHLYSVPVNGGSAENLTPGAFEVEYVTMSADRHTMIYNSNQGDIDRRDLWSVPADGGRSRQLTQGDDIEWSPMPVADGQGTIALLRSGTRIPAHVAIRDENGAIEALGEETLPADFPTSSLVVPQQVVFKAADGMPIHAQLFLPRDAGPGDQRAGVLFFHGGSRRQMLLGWHYGGYYHNAYALNQYLASQGYVVMSVNYRSGIGYGMEFREALNYGATGASEFNDVLGAGLYLQNRPEVDPDKIGLWGGSYGGYLTALGLARASDLFAAGVDLHGVHDWNIVIRNFQPSYDPLELREAARLAFESSPMASIDTWRSPVLLVHGDDDRNVPFSETVDLVEGLRARGVPFELIVYPDEVHSFTLYRRWFRTYSATADFFDKYLRLSKGGSTR
jgi:dipeptidyl aminopeptidase/acylaminoacyl peptidase